MNDVVIIESVTEAGTEWLVSFDGPNPDDDKCIRVANAEEAAKLKRLVDGVVSSTDAEMAILAEARKFREAWRPFQSMTPDQAESDVGDAARLTLFDAELALAMAIDGRGLDQLRANLMDPKQEKSR